MRKYTNAELADFIEDEGAGYAIEEYVDPDRIADPETRALWLTAKGAIGAVAQRVFRAKATEEDAET